MNISINSNGGRIGNLWWFNSDQQPRTALLPVTFGIIDTGLMLNRKVVCWGTSGFGLNVRIAVEVLDD
jgi:hypothetical protein